jgi:hypothetical protein
MVGRHAQCIKPSPVGSHTTHHTYTLRPIIADADVNDTAPARHKTPPRATSGPLTPEEEQREKEMQEENN